jgi:FSR family fosmidomycin resistance protein-like MFS transporter
MARTVTQGQPDDLGEPAPVVDTARQRFAATIVIGHAVKHTVTSGLSSVLIPEIKLRMGLNATQVGSLGSVQQFTGWAATMSAGYMGDRAASRVNLMLATSLGFTSLALFVIGVAQNYWMLLLGMLFMGFGPSMFHPPAIGALSRRFADRRSFAISLHGTGGSVGEMLGPLLAAGLLAVMYWRGVLYVEFVIGAITAVLLYRLLRNSNARENNHDHDTAPGSFREYLTSFTSLLRHKTLLMIFLVTALRGVGQATNTIFLPVYLREDLGYSASLVAVYIALGQLAGIGSQPLMGHLADRVGHKAVILPALIMFAILLALIPVADGKIQLAIIILLLGLFVFSMQSILTSAAVEQAGPGMHSTITSMVYASTFLGSLSPTVAGGLADSYGLQSTFYLSFALVGAAAVVMALTKLPRVVHRT